MQTTPTLRTATHTFKPVTASKDATNNSAITSVHFESWVIIIIAVSEYVE